MRSNPPLPFEFFESSTWKFVQAKSKQAMKQVLGIENEAACIKVTPPLAVALLAHGDDDMQWAAPSRPGGTAEQIQAEEQPWPRG